MLPFLLEQLLGLRKLLLDFFDQCSLRLDIFRSQSGIQWLGQLPIILAHPLQHGLFLFAVFDRSSRHLRPSKICLASSCNTINSSFAEIPSVWPFWGGVGKTFSFASTFTVVSLREFVRDFFRAFELKTRGFLQEQALLSRVTGRLYLPAMKLSLPGEMDDQSDAH